MMYVYLFVQSLMILALHAAWKQGRGYGLAAAFGSMMLSACIAMPLLVITNITIAIGAVFATCLNARPAQASVLAAVLALLWFGVALGSVIVPELAAWERLRQDYPIQVLDDRLARRSETPSSAATDARVIYQPELPAEIVRVKGSADDRLADFERALASNPSPFHVEIRVGTLERMHAGQVKQFVESSGFGVMRRILRPTPSEYRLSPPQHDFTQPLPAQLTGADERTPTTTLGGSWAMHRDSAADFAHPWSLGYVPAPRRAAGFLPHQFRRMPGLPQQDPMLAEQWTLDRVELIGLLVHPAPVVYESDQLPDMRNAATARTRALDQFEAAVLAELLRGEDLLSLRSDSAIRMVGAVRAATDCLKCHDANRGDLLGAFTYRLSRSSLNTPPSSR